MARYRGVQSKFFTDPKIQQLNPEARFLYLYLLLNEHRNQSGLYDLSVPTMAYETGMTVKNTRAALKVLCDSGRVAYDEAEEIVWAKKAARYERFNAQARVGVKIDLDHCSSEAFRKAFTESYPNLACLSQDDAVPPYAPPRKEKETEQKRIVTETETEKKKNGEQTPESPLETTQSDAQVFDRKSAFENVYAKFPVSKQTDRTKCAELFFASVTKDTDVYRISEALRKYKESAEFREHRCCSDVDWFSSWQNWDPWMR
jgi:hypothetical protein